jgi:acetyl/propionyl-CoA carboxylase alpha subunit
MGEAAVAAARAAGYQNAGTIEFLLEGTGDAARFYFLEMNTRLQVEHPVTEAVTGIDLVRAQIRIASGERLPWEQGMLAQRGHAIECRVYAEDPAEEFLPRAGPLLLYREPHAPGVRIDSGVMEGGEISVHYDPMVAKVIAHAETRGAAVARMSAALRDFPILGIQTNVPYVLEVLAHPAFVAGAVDTRFLDRETPAIVAGLSAARVPPAAVAAAAAEYSRAKVDLAPMPGRKTRSGADRSDPWDLPDRAAGVS